MERTSQLFLNPNDLTKKVTTIFFNQPTVHHRLAKQNSRRKRSGQKKYSSLDNAPTGSVTQGTIC